MHIEAGVVNGAKMLLSYGTAAGVFAYGAKESLKNIKQNGVFSFLLKSLLSTMIVFSCFEVLPHYPVGVSEVHLILGTTIFFDIWFSTCNGRTKFGTSCSRVIFCSV